MRRTEMAAAEATTHVATAEATAHAAASCPECHPAHENEHEHRDEGDGRVSAGLPPATSGLYEVAAMGGALLAIIGLALMVWAFVSLPTVGSGALRAV
jgi:hypothetical protein